MEPTWVITDTDASFRAADFLIPGDKLGLPPGAYCRKLTLRGGRQEGVEVIEISNGTLSLRVCPTRGMGILDGRLGSHALGWSSPVREIVHPQYIHLLEMGGRGCHYGFNELLNRCGIEWSGAMGEDETVDNMGRRSRVFLPLHGKVGWTPASRVCLRVQGDALVLEGDVPEQILFGVNYLLRTRLVLSAFAARFTIEDTLVNLGDGPGEYEMLYHTNFGPPFLEKGSRYRGSYDTVVPRDEAAAAGLDELSVFPAPTPGFVEQVFLFRAHADEQGFAHQLLANAAEDLAVRVSFRADTLPYAILWKRCAAAGEGYVVGLNPCSDLPNPRRLEREQGRVGRIEPGAEVVFVEGVELFEGREAVQDAAAALESSPGARRIAAAGDFAAL
ncbi:MAG: DUF4432 family protein [Spirochaetales bacterium]|nr:DUF4432 family protein [Spirochaetales bacterium]